jgi:hypothetical protein
MQRRLQPWTILRHQTRMKHQGFRGVCFGVGFGCRSAPGSPFHIKKIKTLELRLRRLRGQNSISIHKLARIRPMPARRRRYLSPTSLALGNNPPLLSHHPTPSRARRDHFEARNLRHRRMVSRTPMSSHPCRITQGGARRRNPTEDDDRRLLTFLNARPVPAQNAREGHNSQALPKLYSNFNDIGVRSFILNGAPSSWHS